MISEGLRYELMGGPYEPPPTERRAFLTCEMRGKVKVGEMTLLGKFSDHKVAKMLGCSRRQVVAKRAHLGIPAPEAYEPNLSKEGTH